ncbi:MAG: RagB/SusD family nutrient uptake outer membrane protein, partial [Ginsengibacter sp.]
APISERNAQNFYKTQSDFGIAVNGAYDGLQLNGTYGRAYLLLSEMRSDNTSNGGGASGLAATLQEIDDFKEIATASELQSAWSDSYNAIARCNTILDKIDGADFNESIKDQYKGQALFIRSLVYYNLAIIFGNIPLQLHAAASTAEINLEQVTPADVYQQIIADLKLASDKLPAKFTGENTGRATRNAANALLGKVYLTIGDKANAKTVLQQVIDSHQYELVNDYARLWGPANENNIESIFEVQYKGGGQREGSGYVEYFASPLSKSGGVGGGNTPLSVTNDMLNAYEANDDRFRKSIYTNYKDTTYVTKYVSNQISAFDSENNWVVLRYADVLLMMAEALGESDAAYALINQVRERAHLPSIDSNDPGSFEEKLLHERHVEFAFENQRWPDLLRFGVAQKVMAKHLGISESMVHLLAPIPQREIDVSLGKLKQNPGR